MEKAASKQQVIDAKNDESKSHLTAATAKEKLKVFGVTEEQIDFLTKNLGDTPMPEELHMISDKARMTRLSPVEGSVIQRDAVPGNLYDNNDVLLTIALLDHLFVWVNVYEADQAKVAVGQEIEIRFPYLEKTVLSKVEYIASEVSKDTRAILLHVRAQHRRQAQGRHAGAGRPEDSAGRGADRDPAPGDGGHERREYRVRPEAGTIGKGTEQFERGRWLSPRPRRPCGRAKWPETRRSRCFQRSLGLAQLYEDQQMVATGMPLK